MSSADPWNSADKISRPDPSHGRPLISHMEKALEMILFRPIAVAASLVAAASASFVIAQEPKPTEAASGAYLVDGRHASVIARIGHAGGISKSVFRFNKVSGALRWNAASPAGSSVSIIIDPRSIATPVEGFAEELAGEKFLKSATFPTIRFDSTAVRITGANKGQVIGDLTFLGVRKPVTLDVTFGGVGQNRTATKLGFAATTQFDRRDFGLNFGAGSIGDNVEILIDIEFDQKKPT